MTEFEFGIKDGENQVKIFDIAEFIDDDRVHPKRIKATLKSDLNISSFVNINVVAPAIRSTEKEGEIHHKFLKTYMNSFFECG
jgi:hypothetical protein